ncbi:MAG: porin family protein [Myxococcales bacterium]|nr:porin family protein [Myxococcales bacterium]
MIARFICSTLLLAVAASAPGWAQEEPDYGRTGYYVGGGLAIGREMFDEVFPADIDTGVGFDINAGYRVTEFWGAELDLRYMNAFDMNGDLIPETSRRPAFIRNVPSADLKSVRMLDITANIAIYPLRGRIQPYIKAGAGVGWAQAKFTSVTTSGWDGVVRGGLGLDYYLTKHIVVNIEALVLSTFDDINGLDHISVVFGGRYRF